MGPGAAGGLVLPKQRESTQYMVEDAAYSPAASGLEDIYPKTEAEHAAMVSWCVQAFTAADRARQSYQPRWERYYRQYRSYVKRKVGDWHSKVFYPIAFWIIEAIAPRLVASLPKMRVLPMGPEDVEPAQGMETMLEWASNQSDLYVELVKATKSSLKYGTGLLKTYERQDIRRARKLVQGPLVPQVMTRNQPSMDDNGLPRLDMNNQPIMDRKEVLMGYTNGEMEWQTYEYTAYDGPAAEAIDIFNFWPAPEAVDVETARYVIHRTYRDGDYIMQRVAEGVYQIPQGMTIKDIGSGIGSSTAFSPEPHLQRLQQIGLSDGAEMDPTRRPVELLEFWTAKGNVITLANRCAILRAHENPFDHGEKPFIRIVDHLAEHEFWGIGELEPLEGLQDLMNAIVNQRIDNIRLVLNSMFAVNTKYVEDLRDLTPRPGGIIRFKDDVPVSQVFQRVDLGNVTQEAFEEASATEAIIEKASGVTAYQLGTDSTNMNATATGVSLIQEAGATRFQLKTRLAELMGMKHLARHFASLIQQFTTEDRVVRLLGPQGEMLFQTFDPESLQGAFDFDIETSSSVQTESQRRAEAMNLLQAVAPLAPMAIPQLVKDLLMAFDKKNVQAYLPPQMPGMVPGMMPQPGMGPGQDAAQSGQPMLPPGLPPFQAPTPIMPQQRIMPPR